MGRAVSSDISPSMGSIVWTVLYDEIVYVIDGVFIVKTNSQTYTAQKGEVMWISRQPPSPRHDTTVLNILVAWLDGIMIF